ncbi:hypothetical protein PR003_g24820 [Phytophthora rubi]|uniref:Uncharacterized protein n=1 Tax=Phytophthora rubi TaxID=129364 RepID=A0A6A4CJB6_9STRA|nr:hypothetical protein PR002_g24073 [Phytophthora rubi]KAE9292190.1 hypothetical protein PR003_g24820 [Phytophthora rubi]
MTTPTVEPTKRLFFVTPEISTADELRSSVYSAA